MPQPAAIASIAPFFIVSDVARAINFYNEQLGFKTIFCEPADNPHFAIVQRDNAMIFLKAVGVEPAPNHTQHPWARWDAYVNVPDPDSLADEFLARGVAFAVPLKDTDDGLRGFELKDIDGYTLFFGRPR